MNKKYKITYSPYKDVNKHFIELDLCFVMFEIGMLVFTLSKKMFTTDLLSAIILIAFPIIIFLIYKLLLLLLNRCQLIIDYQSNKLIIKKVFSKKSYNLDEIKIKKELFHKNNPHFIPIQILAFYYKDKRIYKINATHFENLTNHQIDNILQ